MRLSEVVNEPEGEVMNAKQIDPKYHVEIQPGIQMALSGMGKVDLVTGLEIYIVNDRGAVVPSDEPLFVLRAKDRNALATLRKYLDICQTDGCPQDHIDGILNRIDDFLTFAAGHPERMKQPGVTRGL